MIGFTIFEKEQKVSRAFIRRSGQYGCTLLMRRQGFPLSGMGRRGATQPRILRYYSEIRQQVSALARPVL
jgi:hypothetical protein